MFCWTRKNALKGCLKEETRKKDTKSTEKESTEVNLLTIRGQGLEDKNISMDPTTQEDSKIIWNMGMGLGRTSKRHIQGNGEKISFMGTGYWNRDVVNTRVHSWMERSRGGEENWWRQKTIMRAIFPTICLTTKGYTFGLMELDMKDSFSTVLGLARVLYPLSMAASTMDLSLTKSRQVYAR